jgi:hypothetical protein
VKSSCPMKPTEYQKDSAGVRLDHQARK